MFQRREAVERNALRLEVADRRLDGDEPVLETEDVRVITDDAQHPIALHLVEVEPPSSGVAHELVATLLECEQQASLAGRRATLKELGDSQRLARSSCA